MEHHRGISLLLLVIYNIFALAAVIYHPTRSLFILGMISPSETVLEMRQTQTWGDIQTMTTAKQVKSIFDYSNKVDTCCENVEMQS